MATVSARINIFQLRFPSLMKSLRGTNGESIRPFQTRWCDVIDWCGSSGKSIQHKLTVGAKPPAALNLGSNWTPKISGCCCAANSITYSQINALKYSSQMAAKNQ